MDDHAQRRLLRAAEAAPVRARALVVLMLFTAALWVSRAGGWSSARSADRDVRAVAAMAGLELSAHTLRHTCLTALVRRGNDLVDGRRARRPPEARHHAPVHRRPSAADRQAAVEDLQIDY